MRVAGEAIARQARIENGDLAAGAAELQGGGEAGKAAADDDDVIHGDGLRVDGLESPVTRTREMSGVFISVACEWSVKCVVALAVRIGRIPAPTQCAEGGDRRACCFGSRLRFCVPHLQKVPVCIQNFNQADYASLISGQRVLARTCERELTARQDADLGLPFDEGGKRV